MDTILNKPVRAVIFVEKNNHQPNAVGVKSFWVWQTPILKFTFKLSLP
jgi:hypothetical protein